MAEALAGTQQQHSQGLQPGLVLQLFGNCYDYLNHTSCCNRHSTVALERGPIMHCIILINMIVIKR